MECDIEYKIKFDIDIIVSTSIINKLLSPFLLLTVLLCVHLVTWCEHIALRVIINSKLTFENMPKPTLAPEHLINADVGNYDEIFGKSC